MEDHIIDSNVLLVASAQHPGSPFDDSDHVPAEQKQHVLDWLIDFRKDSQRKLVLDQSWKIMSEYRHKMTDQDYGLMVVKEKLQFARIVDIEFDENGHGRLPAELEKVVHDLADRKFVALALTDKEQGGQSSIVAACEGDWYDWEDALGDAAVIVVQVIEDWSRAEWEKKQKQKSKPKIGHRPPRSRKKN